jgi:hypothetical protein
MVDGTQIALIITASGGFVGSVGAVVLGWRNQIKIEASAALSANNSQKLEKVMAKVEEVHASTNGKMDELLKISGQAEKAKGVIEGLQQGRDEGQNK